MAALHLTERLVHINLEIIYLLTGENFGPVKKDRGEGVSVTKIKTEESNNDQKILELVNKIIELLTNWKHLYGGTKMANQQPIRWPEPRPGRLRPPDSPCAAAVHSVALQDQSASSFTTQQQYPHSGESLSHGDQESFPHSDISTPTDPVPHIKEEPRPMAEEHLPHPETSPPALRVATATSIRTHQGEPPPHVEVTLSDGETAKGESLPHSSSPAAGAAGQGGELGYKPYLCTECGKRFRYNTWFVAHQKTHMQKPAYCSECDRHFSTPEALKKHQRAHSAPKVPCPECGKLFPTKTDLRNHQMSHARQRSYVCSECGMRFSSNANRLKHQRMHQGEMVYQCLQCEKCFTNPDRLQRHQRLHTGERLFSCTECDRSFIDRCDLVKHMRIHTGERPFLCLECGSSFYNSSNFLRHWRAHAKKKP